MAAFQKLSKLICPKCGRRGAATWEKGDGQLRQSQRSLNDLSAGFVAVDVGGKEGPRVLCEKCRVPATGQ